MNAFGECGTQHQSLVTEGVFPRVIEAIHQVNLSIYIFYYTSSFILII